MKKQPLHQVTVEQAGTRIPVGPRQPREGCERFVEAINAQIALGRERNWKDPQIAAVL